MKMDRLQRTNLDWYVKDMHRLKESTLKRHLPQLLEWKQAQVEGIDFEETFSPVARMEAI
jgi:hypothetical protein